MRILVGGPVADADTNSARAPGAIDLPHGAPISHAARMYQTWRRHIRTIEKRDRPKGASDGSGIRRAVCSGEEQVLRTGHPNRSGLLGGRLGRLHLRRRPAAGSAGQLRAAAWDAARAAARRARRAPRSWRPATARWPRGAVD